MQQNGPTLDLIWPELSSLPSTMPDNPKCLQSVYCPSLQDNYFILLFHEETPNNSPS